MPSLRRLLPSLDHLVAFEAAGRLGAFSAAAGELRVTQAAVSYAIRALEDDLGQPLFLRGQRGVRLTEAGQRLHGEVAVALGLIEGTVARLRASAGTGHVTLSVSTAFATYWMLPRLALLRAALPDVEIRVQTTDRDIDLGAEGIALGVRYGAGVLAHYEGSALAPERIFPAASPGYLAGLGRGRLRAADLAGLALVHLDEPHRPCPTWGDWFASQGVAYRDPGTGLRLNDYALVVQAALESEGVILGWEHLIGPQIAAGTLVRASPEVWATGTAFQVVWAGPLAPNAARLRDWLIAQGAP